MGSFEEHARLIMSDAIDSIHCDLNGIKRQPPTISEKLYEFKCTESHSYTWNAQDINNGQPHDFKENEIYYFKTSPEFLYFTLKHPDKFEFIRELIDVK